ncbi:MAG: hypothetical protein B9S32_05045 [Verrucomicrobia bacterium Tous-C9LFEB]|nr:MAG: hypothetical protein B9S32_05045 [Verrucomicrobia bacterium Tous-C9LFEB]
MFGIYLKEYPLPVGKNTLWTGILFSFNCIFVNPSWLKLLSSTFAEKAVPVVSDLLPQWIYCGYETRTVPRDYSWHGLKRGADPRHPYIVFQYTLDGEGLYEEKGRRIPLRAGDAFLTVIPSAHSYRLPEHSSSWTFYWMIIHHPTIRDRLIHTRKEFGTVFALPSEAALHMLSAQICEQVVQGRYEDRYAFELALWEWTLELERALSLIRSPAQGREQLLNWTRRQWAQRKSRTLAATDLAHAAGMSRSNFSHHFRKVTGFSPAPFLLQLRLHEAANRLRHGNDKLDVIAHELGFVDASHLSKAIHRHYRMNPGMLRRLLHRK